MSTAPTAIECDAAPAALGPYSQAVRAGDLLLVSGQLGIEPASMQLAGASAAQQARQAFDNVQAIVASAGGTLEDVVKVVLYLVDLSQFDAVNQVMADCFAKPYPARACVEVAALPRGALVEVEATAWLAARK